MGVGYLGLTEGLLAEAFARSAIAKAVIRLEAGGSLGPVDEVNDALCRLTGQDRERLVGQPCAKWLDGGGEDRIVVRPDGSRVPVRCHLVVAGDAYAVVELVLVEDRDAQAARLRTTIAAQQEITVAARDRDDVLRLVTDRTFRVLPSADTCVVQLVDEEHQVLRGVAGAGMLAARDAPPPPLQGSLTGIAIATGELVRCDDMHTDPRADPERARVMQIRSLLAAPLWVGADRPIGVLLVGSTRAHAFDAGDEQQLTLLAHALSGALRHAGDIERTATLLAERTEALAALQISENRFRLAFDNSPLGLTLISLEPDTVGHYLAANTAMSRITGYTEAELTTMTYRDLVHPENAPTGTGYLSRTLDGPVAPTRAEYRYRHKDGRDVWVAVSTAAVRDDAGRPLYLVNQIEDITEKRAAEIALRRQARMLELTPAAVIVRGLDGTVLWWNTGAAALYGWSAETATGKITHELLETVFPDGTTLGDVETALQADGRWDGELVHRTADGSLVTVLSQHVLHEDQILEINTDVTAARAAERALAVSEHRFRAQFAHSAAGQIVGDLNGRLIDANPAFARMVGYPVEQLIGMSSQDLLDPADFDDSEPLLSGLLDGSTDFYTQAARLRRADDRWITVDATMSLVRDHAGRPTHLVGVIIDSTDQRAAERARDQAADELADRNDQLEHANQLKLDIIAMLGFEIRNPLASIRGYAEILGEDWNDLDDAFRARALTAVARQADRVDAILREVLTMVIHQ